MGCLMMRWRPWWVINCKQRWGIGAEEWREGDLNSRRLPGQNQKQVKWDRREFLDPLWNLDFRGNIISCCPSESKSLRSLERIWYYQINFPSLNPSCEIFQLKPHGFLHQLRNLARFNCRMYSENTQQGRQDNRQKRRMIMSIFEFLFIVCINIMFND